MSVNLVITCSDKHMLPAACCTLLSVRDNICGAMPNFAILAIGISQAEKEALGAFNARHKIDIEILDIVLPQDLPEANGRWIKSTLARLYIDLAVSREIDRMLYLDADTMAVAPIDEIFSIDLQGRALGAIDDYVTAFPEKAKRREASLQ